MAITGAAGAPTRIDVPAEGDLLDVKLRLASVDATPPSRACAHCDESGLPDRPLSPPNRLFTPRGEGRLRVLTSWDPNDKQGPEGDGGLLRPGSWAEYTIQFENKPTVELAARNVVIEDELDEEILDLSTLRVTGIRIADRSEQAWSFEIDSADRYAGYSSPATPGNGVAQRSLQVMQQPIGGEEVSLEVSYRRELDMSDPEHPKLVFSFATQSSDTLQGFLLPNDPAGLRQGEAQVSFAVQLKEEADIADDDDELRNKANIRFDSLAPIETRIWSNGILRGAPPAQPVFSVPASGSIEPFSEEGVLLQWVDSGATAYVLRVWETGTPRPEDGFHLQENFYKVDPTSLEAGRSYTWQVVAINADGIETSSEPWTFSVRETTPLLTPPVELEPVDGAVVSLPLELNWSDVDGAAAYAVTLVDATGAARRYAGLGRSELYGIADLAPDTLYTWWVEAVNAEGKASRSSERRFTTAGDLGPDFLRGDPNGDDRHDISDAISILGFLFLGTPSRLACEKSADSDDSGGIDITDAVYLLAYGFLGGSPPPFPECASDPTQDGLACNVVEGCR